jgi:cell division protein FtsX
MALFPRQPWSPAATRSSAQALVVGACMDLRRHPRSTLAVVASVAASLVLLGAAALGSAQVGLVEHWYRDGLVAGQPGPDSALARQLLPLLAWGRGALAAALAGGALALAVAVLLSMRVAAATRAQDVRALVGSGASRADVRVWLLAQATANGLAAALVAFVVLRLGTDLLLRSPRHEAALEGLRMIGAGELWAVLPLLVAAGVAACAAGCLLAQRALARA